MTRYTLICAAFLLAAPAAAQDQEPATPVGDQLLSDLIEPRSDPADFDLARKKVVDCEGEKFLFAWGAGARPTKVTLCSKKNATRDELVEMLDDAATKLEQSDIAEDRRTAIVQQIRAKIAELQSSSAAATAPKAAAGTSLLTHPPADAAPAPVPPPAPSAQAATPPPVLQPLKPVSQPVLPPKPRLSFECDTVSGSGGPCTILKPDTRLVVTAGESLPGGIELRFRRKGQTRGEVTLGSLRQGQSVRVGVPSQLCKGVFKSESEIQVVRNGQVVDSVGPYLLRC